MKESNTYSGPLAGLNVIDFGHYYAGPMTAMLLADQGANVIRIVRPGGKELPDPQYRLLNRNKKILELDLKTSEGKEQAQSLIERADILIENFRPGVMQRLGLDYASVTHFNPGLIYLSLPGFASTDTARAPIQAWEGILGSANGLFTESHFVRQELGYPPVYSAVPLSSMYGGINGALSVTAALLARERHGVGTFIEVVLSDAGLTAFEIYYLLRGSRLSMGATSDNEEVSLLPSGIKKYHYSSAVSDEINRNNIEKAEKTLNRLWFIYHLYPCADGRLVYVQVYKSFARRFLKLLDINDQFNQEGFCIESAWESGLDNNLCGGMSEGRRERLIQLIGDALLTKPAEEWESLLQNAGGHISVVRTRQEWLALKAHFASGLFVEMDNGKSKLIVPGRLAGITGPGGSNMIPTLQELEFIDSAQAQNYFGDAKRDASSAGKSKANPNKSTGSLTKGNLLRGVKVVDLANVVAGPSISVHLAEYGAEVIKVDPPTPSHYAPAIMAQTLITNRGKRSVLTDLTTAPGREILKRLVSEADLVVHNSVDGTAERLGATYEQLSEVKPDIVVCQLTAMGGPQRGGWGSWRGAEQNVQGVTGLTVQYGSEQSPHKHTGVGMGDVPSGFCGAFTALLGLYQKHKTGLGSECRTSLVQVANYIQLPLMISENGNSDWGAARGQDAKGDPGKWWQRLYKCSDGWIFVGTSKQKANQLLETVLGHAQADEAKLEATFATQSCASWADKFIALDIGCHRVVGIDDLIVSMPCKKVSNDCSAEEANGPAESLCWENHNCGFSVKLPSPDYVRVGENQSYYRPSASPRLGSHTVEVLTELGYDKEKISKLLKIGAAFEYYPPLGSKKAFLYPESKG